MSLNPALYYLDHAWNGPDTLSRTSRCDIALPDKTRKESCYRGYTLILSSRSTHDKRKMIYFGTGNSTYTRDPSGDAERLMDGLGIVTGYHMDPALELIIALAVCIHEIYRGVTTAITMREAGYPLIIER